MPSVLAVICSVDVIEPITVNVFESVVLPVTDKVFESVVLPVTDSVPTIATLPTTILVGVHLLVLLFASVTRQVRVLPRSSTFMVYVDATAPYMLALT